MNDWTKDQLVGAITQDTAKYNMDRVPVETLRELWKGKELEIRLLHTAIEKSNEALAVAVETKEERDRLLLQVGDLMKALASLPCKYEETYGRPTEGHLALGVCPTCWARVELWITEKRVGESWMVTRACPEHGALAMKPFKWGPPPWHPCPNCKYEKAGPRVSSGDQDTVSRPGPECPAEKRACQCPMCGVPLSGPLVQRCVNGCDF